MQEKSILDEIRIVDNLIKRSIDKRMKENGLDVLTSGNGRIIGYLYDRRGEDVFQKDFESCVGITRSTASKVIHLMVEKGYIKRERVSSDARLKKLVLTKQAEDVAQWIHQDHDMMEETLLQGFSEEELEHLYEYLYRIQSNLKKNFDDKEDKKDVKNTCGEY